MYSNRMLYQAFWDATGGLWAQGALAGKYAGIFVATGTPGGGQGVYIPPWYPLYLVLIRLRQKLLPSTPSLP